MNAPPQNPRAGLVALRKLLAETDAEGEDHVWLSDSSLEQLGTLALKAQSASRRASTPPPAASPPPPATTLREDPPEPTPAKTEPAPASKSARLEALKADAETSTECTSLGTLRDTMVFAVGSHDAQLMFVGEAPGAEEEKQREPFVGPAGQLLTKIIKTMGIQRDDVYISNIVKFRPSTGGGSQGTANRAPTTEEMAVSLRFIKAEIDIVEPKLIVALGGSAMTGLLGLDCGVGRARGQIHDCAGRPAIVTYHPSYLLRSGSLTDKRKVWEDMLFAMEQIGLPISEKHRGFFLK